MSDRRDRIEYLKLEDSCNTPKDYKMQHTIELEPLLSKTPHEHITLTAVPTH